MSNRYVVFNKTARNFPKTGTLLLCSLMVITCFYLPCYGQTIGELSGSLAVQEKLMEQSGQTAARRLAREPNVATDADKSAEEATAGMKPNERSAGETHATASKDIESETPKIPSETQPIETNVPDINDFNSFQRELNLINIRTRNEEQRWLGPMEKKPDLLRAMDELVAAELRFIRKLAESENASETKKAVDLVLRQRQDRLNKLITKLEEEPRQERQQPTERKKSNRAGGQDQPIKERPQKKPREVNANEGQPY